MTKPSKLSVGDWVEVQSKEEILRTLDDNGQLDGMPFMPEMFAFCGQRFQVYKRAHKTCDTVFPIRGRRVDRAVHLETRCDGAAHGGCQAGCLIFWKTAWLKPVSGKPAGQNALLKLAKDSDDAGLRAPRQAESLPHQSCHPIARDSVDGFTSGTSCSEADVWARAQASGSNGDAPVYVCQATRLPYATTDLSWWDIRQYVEDYRSGNVGAWQMFQSAVFAAYYNLSQAGIGLGPAMRWLYDRLHWLWGGSQFPRKIGTIPVTEPTPTGTLDLQPGEWVRVKSHEEILRTINTSTQNRGLYFDAELVPYCGGTYRVLSRVTKIINERTGVMQEMKNPCIILESVFCQARYSSCRLFCPRSIYSYWREIWLERVGEGVSGRQESEAVQYSSDVHAAR